jgi:pimeloyl-ACP methyl ester carboxylesterase
MMLSLVAEDPAPNVVYLARPCQYTPPEQNPKCDEFYWTDGRFSEDVVRSMDQGVSYFIEKAKAPGAALIGYSGGAAVAVLVTARRKDILSLRTIAGNLDPELVNRYHKVSPLEGSLDPMDVAEKVASVPQLHFIGGDDEIIPLATMSSFLKKMGDERCFRTKTVPDASHQDGWIEPWKHLLREPVACKEPPT